MAGELQKTMEKGGPPAPISGKKNDAPKDGLLTQAYQRIESLKSGISSSRERMGEVGDMVIATVETTATNVIASAAEGYWGADKMSVGPVDLRLPAGGGLALIGFYKAINGKGGAHELALGNGFLQSLTSSVGRRAGEALREKGNGAGAGGNGGGGNPGGLSLQEGAVIEQGGKKYRMTGGALVEFSGATADVEGLVRDIGRNLQISEGDEDGDENAGRRRGRKRKGRRQPDDFVPVRARR